MVLDITDKKILYELDLDCKQPNSKIAKKLKISKDIVNYRIQKLEQQGIIEGYRAVIDIYKLGYFTFRVYLKFKDLYKEKEKEIINYLKKVNGVWWAGTLAGRTDFIFTFSVKSPHEFYNFFEGFLKKYRKYVQSEEICTLLEYKIHTLPYLKEVGKDVPLILGSQIQVKSDPIDRKIISLIANNARVPLIDIAKKINLTPMAIKHRIKSLEKKEIIKGYRAMINVTKLGYEYYKVDLFLENMSKIKQIQAFCEAHKNIFSYEKTIGGGDLECDFQVKNLNEFITIMEELKENFKGAIRNYEYFSVQDIHKTIYFSE